jgi:CheY-like chemotaxis protein
LITRQGYTRRYSLKEGKLEEKVREIQIEESRYYLGRDNIGYVTIVGEADEKTANRYRDAGLTILDMIEGSLNILVDVNRAGKLSPEVRSVFKELSENEKSGKVAIFGLSPVARVIASFVMGTAKKKAMRFFKTREEALDVANKENPDLIIMDVHLPKMSGLEATRKLRENPTFTHTSIIGLTAYAMKGDKEIVIRAGCDAYLSKPVNTRELPRIIAGMLRKRQKNQDK